ncbi:UNVERIFIED_CONTAM: RNA polymerase II subunit-mediating protein [Sesamum angustifolium]|uniref:RNA polymerase II subunit-mediating protein n=1 Tax=Sesamum angustifolium TaxID=2727405 RepID=A0AAW2MM82_9LAMI
METMGTVTPISSVFPAEEAQKASRRVQDTIVERQQQLDQLKGFIDDNVPFGKAAFFPGRLIHTNEFMVLLGEAYYAERTAKQTVDILKRRGKALETKVESLKAIMQDLEAEASFFDATAQESADGLVEIREDYVEEASSRAETSG